MTTKTRRWVSLGIACQMVGVNEATLRHWADNGMIRSFRTPGGHRRFLQEDLLGLLEKGRPVADGEGDHTWDKALLQRIRRRLHRGKAGEQPWYQGLDEEAKTRMRLLGRRLLALLAQSNIRSRRQELLQEAYLMGQDYGREMLRQSIPLSQAVEAFIFFHSSLMEVTQSQAWPRLALLTNQVLRGISRAYDPALKDREPVPTSPPN